VLLGTFDFTAQLLICSSALSKFKLHEPVIFYINLAIAIVTTRVLLKTFFHQEFLSSF